VRPEIWGAQSLQETAGKIDERMRESEHEKLHAYACTQEKEREKVLERSTFETLHRIRVQIELKASK